MKTNNHQMSRRLRPFGRAGLAVIVIVLVGHLGLATHAALHSPIAGDADCVYCDFGQQPGAAQPVKLLAVTVASDARLPAIPVAPLPAKRLYRIQVRGPPLYC